MNGCWHFRRVPCITTHFFRSINAYWQPCEANGFKTPLKPSCFLFLLSWFQYCRGLGLRGSSLSPGLSLAGCSGDLCPAALACHSLSEVSTRVAGPQAGSSQSLPKHYFLLPSSHQRTAPSIQLQSFPLLKVRDLIAPSPSLFRRQQVPRPLLCYLQTSAVPKPRQGGGASQWGKNSFSPGTEEDKVSCLFSPSHLSLPHTLSQAGLRLMAAWMVLNPCLTRASKGEPLTHCCGTMQHCMVAKW